MKVHPVPTVLTALTAIAVGKWIVFPRPQSYMPWHENDNWSRFLKVYDALASSLYGECDSKLVPTTFGESQIHACGKPSNPAVVLIHGASINSLMYGDWLAPELVADDKYVIAVDFICESGRSIPKDRNPDNCPTKNEELAQWLHDILVGLSLERVSLVGYSFGATVAVSTALYYPDMVDKLVLLAPAVFTPMLPSFLWMALLFNLFQTDAAHNWFYGHLTTNATWSLAALPAFERELHVAIRGVGASRLLPQVVPFSDEELHKVTSNHSTMMGTGSEDAVIDPLQAKEKARATGASKVIIYNHAGHLMCIEHPTKNDIVRDVVEFLNPDAVI